MDEYEYRDAAEGCAHGYLTAPLLALLASVAAPGARVLDVGCGNGHLTELFAERGYAAYGCDTSRSGVGIAQGREQKARFAEASAYDDLTRVFPGVPEFDVVTAVEVIEHLYSPPQLVRRAKEALRPGGWLIVTTPYHGYLKNLALAASGKLDAHFTVLWEHGHIKFFSRKTLTALLTSEGFVDVRFSGAGRAPYLWKTMLLAARKPA